MEKTYIVTGAYGHLGNTVIRLLADRGERVRGFVLPGDPPVPFVRDYAEIVEGDVRDPASLEPLFAGEGEQIVIHTAGIVTISSHHQQKVHDVNVGGTRHLIDACMRHRVRKLIHVSSVHAIPEAPMGTPTAEVCSFPPDKVEGLYARTKAEATGEVLRAAGQGLDAVVVHPSGILGPYDYGHGHLTQLVMDYMDHRLTACVKGGYDFVDVRDVAAGILAACDRGRQGECYILSGRYCSIKELLWMLHEISGHKPVKTELPLWFAKAAAPLCEAYYKLRRQPPLYTRYSLYTLESNALFTHEKAAAALGYHPRDLRETLQDTVNWLRANHRIKLEKSGRRSKTGRIKQA